MNKTFIYILLSAFTLANVFLLLKIYIIQNQNRELIDKNEELVITYKEQQLRELNLHNEKIYIDNTFIRDRILSDSNYYLVYAYSGEECSSCIFDDIEMLKKLQEKYKIEKVIVLPAIEETRDNNIELNSVLSGLEYVRVDNEIIVFPFDNESKHRFFAIIDSEGLIKNPFFPNRKLPERTETYFEFINNKINSTLTH